MIQNERELLELAALAKQVQVMREALNVCSSAINHRFGKCHELTKANLALALDNTLATEVLREHEKAIIERCAMAVEQAPTRIAILGSAWEVETRTKECAAAIRALNKMPQ